MTTKRLGAESRASKTVQLSIADSSYARALRDALTRTGPWNVELVKYSEAAPSSVLVLDEASFSCSALPLINPERVVLISRQGPELLAQAWEAGIVSVVSADASLPTVLLAIMAASLRADQPRAAASSEISPNVRVASAPLSPDIPISRPKRCKIR